MPKTYVATVRVNVEDVATIAGYATQNKVIIKTRSDPISIGLELMAKIIRDNHPGLIFNLQQAVEFLNHIGISTSSGNRGARELFKQLGEIELSAYADTIATCTEPEKPEIVDAKKLFEAAYKLEEEKARRDKELQKQMRSFQDITGLDVED